MTIPSLPYMQTNIIEINIVTLGNKIILYLKKL